MTSQRTRARMLERLREQGIRDERVLGAMGAVPRHLFVEEALASRAYEDTALRSEEHTSELQSRLHLVCRLLLEKKKKRKSQTNRPKCKKTVPAKLTTASRN